MLCTSNIIQSKILLNHLFYCVFSLFKSKPKQRKVVIIIIIMVMIILQQQLLRINVNVMQHWVNIQIECYVIFIHSFIHWNSIIYVSVLLRGSFDVAWNVWSKSQMRVTKEYFLKTVLILEMKKSEKVTTIIMNDCVMKSLNSKLMLFKKLIS